MLTKAAGLPIIASCEGCGACCLVVTHPPFYILTQPEGKEAIRTRMEDILQGSNPTPPGP